MLLEIKDQFQKILLNILDDAVSISYAGVNVTSHCKREVSVYN